MPRKPKQAEAQTPEQQEKLVKLTRVIHTIFKEIVTGIKNLLSELSRDTPVIPQDEAYTILKRISIVAKVPSPAPTN